jgi:hypothetical protein
MGIYFKQTTAALPRVWQDGSRLFLLLLKLEPVGDHGNEL